ncbi:hypothetical protein GQ600_2799 [Phytophthora cactorum]|nr:hypothetical protein GQ600_2799 [Phytophthora cactorum]
MDGIQREDDVLPSDQSVEPPTEATPAVTTVPVVTPQTITVPTVIAPVAAAPAAGESSTQHAQISSMPGMRPSPISVQSHMYPMRRGPSVSRIPEVEPVGKTFYVMWSSWTLLSMRMPHSNHSRHHHRVDHPEVRSRLWVTWRRKLRHGFDQGDVSKFKQTVSRMFDKASQIKLDEERTARVADSWQRSDGPEYQPTGSKPTRKAHSTRSQSTQPSANGGILCSLRPSRT